MFPYDDQQVADFCTDCAAAFVKGGQVWNARAGVWPARMQFDAVSTGYPAARSKQLTALYIALGLTPPMPIAPRTYRGNMCGVRIANLPPVSGGSSDASLVLSWFYDRYNAPDRATIRNVWKQRGYVDVLVSWPDSRAAGASAAQFAATCHELIADGFLPCVFLASKDYDPPDTAGILANIAPLLPLLPQIAPRVSLFWEGNLWLSPTVVAELRDNLCPQLTPSGIKCYVHFGPGVFAWQQPGQPTAAFWNDSVGKLTGVLRQRDPNEDNGDKSIYQSRIADCLVRFAGADGFVTDSGFGHPFDDIEVEITASQQFNPPFMSEGDGNSWGDAALATPAPSGPLGPVPCMGSGNGQS